MSAELLRSWRPPRSGYAATSRTVYVHMFDTALANWYGVPGAMCVRTKTCGQQLAIEHNADLYSCDHFVEPNYPLGNISDMHVLELVASPRQRGFGQDKVQHAVPVLPGLRCALRVQRPLPEGPASRPCATGGSSATSARRWNSWPRRCGRTGRRRS